VRVIAFSNWAWEGWVGLGIRLAQNLRVNGETRQPGNETSRGIRGCPGSCGTSIQLATGITTAANAGSKLAFRSAKRAVADSGISCSLTFTDFVDDPRCTV
jgi:hypothetical protein